MVIVIGSSNIDFAVTTDRFPASGETVIGHYFAQSFGGKGANQAVAAARAGAQVVFLSKIGRDAHGRLIEDHLAAQGLNHLALLRDERAPTGVAMILVNERGDNQIAVVPGSNGCLTPDEVRQNATLMAGARVLLVQMEIPTETVLAALTLAKQLGLITILNPAPAGPLSSEILRLVDILTPNRLEAQTLAGSADVAEAAHLLTARGVGAVVVTCGVEGAVLYRTKSVISIPAFPVAAIDSTGAGDAFNGALAYVVADGMPLESAIVTANAAGALATTRRGAQASMPTKREIATLLHSGEQKFPSA